MEAYLHDVFLSAITEIGAPTGTSIKFEVPQNADHGDLSTNVAMSLARAMKRAPRDLATELISRLRYDNTTIERIDIAGPGFINITFSHNHLINGLTALLKKGEAYGRSNPAHSPSVNLEWVSANPTGKLHAGHGRQVCLGLAIANLLEWTGVTLTREYYFNNGGNQMRNLAKSVRVRYLQETGESIELDDDSYRGQEIVTIAKSIVTEFGDSKKEAPLDFFQNYGERANFESIKLTLLRLGVEHDIFFNENSLYTSGAVQSTIDEFKAKGLAYDKDGAVWLKLSEMGEKEDRVIVKSTGEPTYRLPDICYHRDKLGRGYDEIIDIFGADHIATIPDVLAALRALGFDTDRVKVIIHQMVSFVSGGEVIKFSKRSGGNYYLDELLDDVGTDAAKFFFIMRAAGSHLEFDVELAKEQSDKNPVYYVQYAHARIASIIRFALQNEKVIDPTADLSVLKHPEEIALIKVLLHFPEIVQTSAHAFAPHHICEYLRNVAAQFHRFYHDCRIVNSEPALEAARLVLASATKLVLANGCSILGITAPESM